VDITGDKQVMSLRMTRPTKRTDSSYHQFEKRVPGKVLQRARGQFFMIEFTPLRGDKPAIVTGHLGPKLKFSLKTRDPDVAKVRIGIAEAHFRRLFDGIAQGPSPLTYKQIVALSGEVYRLYVERLEDNPGSPEEWGAFKAFNRAVLEGRISQAPPIPIKPGQITDRQQATALFGDDLTMGIDALPRSEPSPEVLEQRFGLLASWVLAAWSGDWCRCAGGTAKGSWPSRDGCGMATQEGSQSRLHRRSR
jgi:hypothetical protein